MRNDGPLDFRPRVLLVHEKDETRRAVAAVLLTLPIAIVITTTCAEARARAECFAVAIYADRLADGFGDELARSMKSSGQVHAVLFLSASADAYVLARLCAVGTVFLQDIDGLDSLRSEVARLLGIAVRDRLGVAARRNF
jgi:hypothetical protein